MPLGNFSSTNISSEKSGLPKWDRSLRFRVPGFLTPHFGIGGMLSSSSFSLNTDSLAARYLESFDCDSAKAKAAQYHSISLLIGPYFSLPLHNLIIEARILGGITNTSTPDIIGTAINAYAGPNEGSTSTFVQTGASANAFGFDAGLGLKYLLGTHYLISIRADYFYSKPDLSFDNIGRNNISGIVLNDYHEPVTGINLSLGFGYHF